MTRSFWSSATRTSMPEIERTSSMPDYGSCWPSSALRECETSGPSQREWSNSAANSLAMAPKSFHLKASVPFDDGTPKHWQCCRCDSTRRPPPPLRAFSSVVDPRGTSYSPHLCFFCLRFLHGVSVTRIPLDFRGLWLWFMMHLAIYRRISTATPAWFDKRRMKERGGGV